MTFTYGYFDEIFPPPLVSGMDPDAALHALVATAAAGGNPLSAVPTRGRSRQGMINMALVQQHQTLLVAALCGELDAPDAVALRDAVLNGARLSLRPVLQETLYFSTFAPVLQWLGGHRWRVGVPDFGRHAEIESPDMAQVMQKARALYVQWCQEESQRFAAATAKILTGPNSLYHLYWAAVIGQENWVSLAPDIIVEHLNHTLYRFWTPNGSRLYETSVHTRAARVGETLAHKFKQPVTYPDIATLRDWQAGTFAAPPRQEAARWHFDAVTAKWAAQGARLGVLGKGSKRYLLQTAQTRVQLIPHTARRARPVAELECPVAWLAPAATDPLYQEVLLGWAAQHLLTNTPASRRKNPEA